MRSNLQMIVATARSSGASPSEKHYKGSRDWSFNAKADRCLTSYGKVVPDMVGAEPDFHPAKPDTSWMYRKSAVPLKRDPRSRRIK